MNQGDILFNMTQQSKRGDTESSLYVLERFDPLIKKYTQRLNYDDAKNVATNSNYTFCPR